MDMDQILAAGPESLRARQPTLVPPAPFRRPSAVAGSSGGRCGGRGGRRWGRRQSGGGLAGVNQARAAGGNGTIATSSRPLLLMQETGPFDAPTFGKPARACAGFSDRHVLTHVPRNALAHLSQQPDKAAARPRYLPAVPHGTPRGGLATPGNPSTTAWTG